MRNGQNKRMRGRNNNHRKSHNPMARVYESNGPDVKIRGNPSHIAEKYMQLARDAQTSGDPVAAENYYQHAEHYFRLIAAAQEQFRQNNPHLVPPRATRCGRARRQLRRRRDDGQPQPSCGRASAALRHARAAALPAARRAALTRRPAAPAAAAARRSTRAAHRPKRTGDVDRLPSFITGGQPPQPSGHARARTAMTTSPTASRCIAAGAAIAAPRHDPPGGDAAAARASDRGGD